MIKKVERLVRTYQIPNYDAAVLASDKNLAAVFKKKEELKSLVRKILEWNVSSMNH